MPNIMSGFHALIVLTSLTALIACTQKPDVRPVTLGNLVAGSEHFAGRRISTEGVVRSFPEPRHYWLEDDALNRVGLTPETRLDSLEGDRVRVTGTFRFVQGRGRLIDVEHLEKLSSP